MGSKSVKLSISPKDLFYTLFGPEFWVLFLMKCAISPINA